MSAEFTPPKRSRELGVIATQEIEIPPEDCIRTFLGSEVFTPGYEKHQISGLQMDSRATSLTVTNEEGGEVVVLVTNPERAKVFVRDHPG
jgi:hypothetical protein